MYKSVTEGKPEKVPDVIFVIPELEMLLQGVKWVSLIPSLANNVSRFAKFPAKIPEERFPRLFLLRSLKDGAKQRIISA